MTANGPENGRSCVITGRFARGERVARAGSVLQEVMRAAAAGRDLEEATALVHSLVRFDRTPVEAARTECAARIESGGGDPVLARTLHLLDGMLAAGLW